MTTHISATVLSLAFCTAAVAGEQQDVMAVSRTATVQVQNLSAAPPRAGTGVFIAEQFVLTCFHVVGEFARDADGVPASVAGDIVVVLPDGQAARATVTTLPGGDDPAPVSHDFAVLKLSSKLKGPHAILPLAGAGRVPLVGDSVLFSGFPLNVPGLVTLRGMVAGFNRAGTRIFIQAPINKGNSGGAILDAEGRILGLINSREGAISAGLDSMRNRVRQQNGSVTFQGIDPLRTSAEIIDTVDQYISTGLGYAVSVDPIRAYLERHPDVLK
jgi:S1-C subfamily serine protease